MRSPAIRLVCALTLMGCGPSVTCGASITLLHEFNVADGFTPRHGLVYDGTRLYGVTSNGGTSGTNGTVYSILPSGAGFSTLHSFTGSDGTEPRGLALDNGTLYGTTRLGGVFQRGNVYSISTGGTGFGVLHSFTGGVSVPGAFAAPTIVGGRLLGTTASDDSGFANGAAYGVDLGGQNYGLIHGFLGSGAGDGAGPVGELALIGGRVYGTTGGGGTANAGTVFVMNGDGSGYQVLHSFSGLSQANPQSRLISDGTRLYGTTIGNPGFGTVFAMNLDGTGYQVLHTFLGPEGTNPVGDLALSGTTLYGTAWQGGASGGGGTLYSIDTSGSNFGVLHDFFGGPNDGLQPLGGVTIINGVLYGTTIGGGDFGNGTVYSFAVPAPGTLGLAVMSGLLAIRRRRR